MKKNAIIFFIMLQLPALGQEIDLEYIANNAIDLNAVESGNEDFSGFEQMDSLLKDVKIVMLGEQSHLDGTTFETKIKLIKYLHQKLGFDLLVFESSMYECEKAWNEILKGEDIRIIMGKAVNTYWSPLHEFRGVTDYIAESINLGYPLEIKGFDNQISGAIAENTLVLELKEYLNQFDASLVDEDALELLNDKLLKQLWYMNFNEFKKSEARKIMLYLDELIDVINGKEKDYNALNWLRHLKGLQSFISDLKLGTELRDKEMAENLIWIKEANPDRKIICWGATSHFLYNSSEVRLVKKIKSVEKHYQETKMMGNYIKEKYQGKVFTVGFTAYGGEYGTKGYGVNKKVKEPGENTLEYLLGQSSFDNYLLPFRGYEISSLPSRPLGYKYIKTDLTKIMDAIIFNRVMKRANLDKELFVKLYPDHKYIK